MEGYRWEREENEQFGCYTCCLGGIKNTGRKAMALPGTVMEALLCPSLKARDEDQGTDTFGTDDGERW